MMNTQQLLIQILILESRNTTLMKRIKMHQIRIRMIYLTEKAELDATIDETSFATASPGEKDAGVTFRVRGKLSVSKGGQTVLISDSHRIRLRAYFHCHKLHIKPDGWTAMGVIETRRLLEQLDLMVEGNNNSDLKKLYVYQ